MTTDDETISAPDLSGIKFQPVLVEADHKAGSKWTVCLNDEATPYSMGAGFWEVRKRLGGPWVDAPSLYRLTLHDEHLRMEGRPTAPTLEGVISSLASDAECVRHGQTLGEFGQELGYTNLQEGLDAWEGCHRSYRILKRLGLDREEVYAWAASL